MVAMSGPRFRRLLRSTPVRQALVLVAVVAAVNLVSLGAAYLKLRVDLADRIQAELDQEVAGFDLNATAGALSAIVRAKARATDPAKTVLVFLGTDGGQVGNARAVVEGESLRLVPLDGRAPLGQAGYVQDARRLSGGLLLVAVSLAPIADLTATFLTLLPLSLVPTVLISLAVGAVIARRSAHRVAGIEHALVRLSEGDLSARYDTGDRSGDDLSRIGAGVNRLAAKQEAATDALRQVSADIAHELRTPLQRIAVLLHDLRGRLPDGSEAGDLADRASAEVDRAGSVFQAMLQIAQIEGGNLASRFAPFDLAATARQVAELYQPSVEEHGDRLTLDVPMVPAMVRGDADLVAQAIANLVENALRHSPPGSRVGIEVAAGADGSELVVTDDGPGIPEGERDKVTRRLYRLEGSRTTPGHGLGLSLVSAIAQVHSGQLVLEDNAPGLRVRLIFPPPRASGDAA